MLWGIGTRRILFYSEPVDMRKSYTGLLSLTKHVLNEDPLSETLFVFRNRRGNSLKILFFDRTGFCILGKRLETGRFELNCDEVVASINEQQLKLLLDGIMLGRRRRVR